MSETLMIEVINAFAAVILGATMTAVVFGVGLVIIDLIAKWRNR